MHLFPSKNIWRLLGENSEKKFVSISFFFLSVTFFLIDTCYFSFSISIKQIFLAGFFLWKTISHPIHLKKYIAAIFHLYITPLSLRKLFMLGFITLHVTFLPSFKIISSQNAFLLLSSIVNTHHFWRTFLINTFPFRTSNVLSPFTCICITLSKTSRSLILYSQLTNEQSIASTVESNSIFE